MGLRLSIVVPGWRHPAVRVVIGVKRCVGPADAAHCPKGPTMTTTPPRSGGIDAALFRHRLAVIMLPFAAALGSVPLAKRGGLWSNLPTAAGVDDGVAFVVTGVVCALAGLSRIMGEARIGAAVYAQGNTDALVTTGIFSRLRNPLYWGTWLFFVAVAAVWAPAVVVVPVAAAFAFALNGIVRHEEAFLAARFGDAYRHYAQRVPRWLPRLSSGSPSLSNPPSASLNASHVISATLGNLGILSFAAYRVITGSVGQVRGLGSLNILLCVLWVGVVLWRRRRQHALSRADDAAA